MKKIVPIVRLSADFSRILRAVGYRKGHFENDAEHSFQLALSGWSANHQYQLQLNDELIIKYALVHDLVEVYAGDTDAHGDKEKIAAKKERERKALEQLHTKFPNYPEILQVVEDYEHKIDVESQLVYVLDKFIPVIYIFDTRSDYYHIRKVTIDDCKVWLYGKVDYDSLDPRVKKIFDESVKEMETTYSQIFYNK